MSIRFAEPLLLLTLVALALAAAVIRIRLGPARSRRHAGFTALHWGALALLALALAQPQIRTSSRPTTVLVIDRSASIDSNMQTTERRWAAAVAHSSCPEPCRVVQFAGTAQAIPDTRAALAARPPDSQATDFSAALRTALGLVPDGGRVVLLSDGWQTAGDTGDLAAQARARHVQIDTVRLSDPTERYAAVTQIRAPAAVHLGDPIPVQVTIRSSVTEPATLYLSRDGVPVGNQLIDLHPGDNPLLLSYTATAPGWHSFSARIALFSDDVPQNDTLGTTVDVLGAPRVLTVSNGGAGPLTAMLAKLGFAVTSIAPSALPSAPGALAGEDAVVLDDVPAAALSQPQVAALTTAVRDGGLGLVVLGGPHSFSLGRYAHTSLESLLPVNSLVPGNLQRRNVAIELVLDHSGSMIDLAGGVPKIQMVHVAGTQVAKFVAAHHDALGIVDFDIAAHVLVPMQPLATGAIERRVITRVQGLQANGGTNIYAALQAGLEQIERSSAPDKHLLLMTDGISEPENYSPLLSRLDRDHIAVATVALGTDADKSLLYDISKATGGNFYSTNDARQLPLIFSKETRFDVKPVRVSGHVAVLPGNDSPVVRSLQGRRLPPLRGNVVTTLKQGAQADLLAQGTGTQVNPAMAQWQYGAGRVVTFTPGLGAPWASAWTSQTTLWNNTIRWVQRGVSGAPLVPTVISGSVPSLQVDLSQSAAASLRTTAITGLLTSGTGSSYPLTFTPAGPGLYDASLPALPQGIYGFTIDARGPRQLTSRGQLALPYPLEFAPRPANATPLGPLATLTGGRELAPGDPGALTGGGWHAIWWELALAALVLFLAGALGRALIRPTRAPGDGGYRVTRPAARAESASTSSGETSVGART